MRNPLHSNNLDMSLRHALQPQVILAFVKLMAKIAFFSYNSFTMPTSATALKHCVFKPQNTQSAFFYTIIGASVPCQQEIPVKDTLYFFPSTKSPFLICIITIFRLNVTFFLFFGLFFKLLTLIHEKFYLIKTNEMLFLNVQ